MLLDLTAAYDKVDHGVMLIRLHNGYGLSGSMLDLFFSYYVGRTFSVAVNNIMSVASILSCGAPHGSVVGPILFMLHMFPLGKHASLFKNVSSHFSESELGKFSHLLDSLSASSKLL